MGWQPCRRGAGRRNRISSELIRRVDDVVDADLDDPAAGRQHNVSHDGRQRGADRHDGLRRARGSHVVVCRFFADGARAATDHDAGHQSLFDRAIGKFDRDRRHPQRRNHARCVLRNSRLLRGSGNRERRGPRHERARVGECNRRRADVPRHFPDRFQHANRRRAPAIECRHRASARIFRHVAPRAHRYEHSRLERADSENQRRDHAPGAADRHERRAAIECTRHRDVNWRRDDRTRSSLAHAGGNRSA